jgi:hypothetical protein
MTRAPALLVSLLMSAIFAGSSAADAQVPLSSGRQPFTATLSNNEPLAFGMDVPHASAALGQRLRYVSGPPGGEIYLALRDVGGSGLIGHHDRLFLQFRRGRLAGWKEDYDQNWMWR